jgi:hypothetical protein
MVEVLKGGGGGCVCVCARGGKIMVQNGRGVVLVPAAL